MTDHLNAAQLSTLADGELSGDELEAAKLHIDNCMPCAKGAVNEWLLKSAVAKTGRRYALPEEFRNRMAGLVSREAARQAASVPGTASSASRRARNWGAISGWAAAALLLLVLGSWDVFQHGARNSRTEEHAALVTEACDLHIATLAANQSPQVISSDRHTVKPWFQGKLPFSFNLPESLPLETTLEGANLAYLHNHAVAQLLFSIGRHRVSVFVEQKDDAPAKGSFRAAHDGFNVAEFETGNLEAIAVSDVDPARLDSLMNTLEAVQIEH